MNTALYTPRPRSPMEIFKGLPEGTRVQLIENVIVREPAPVCIHQAVSAAAGNALYNFVKQHSLGIVWFAPVDVYLDHRNAFQPDILFVSKERLDIIGKKGLHGAPDLIMEILSPSTCRLDREEKKQVYERSGVKEYWLIDPETRAVQGYRLAKLAFEPLPLTKGRIDSPMLGATFRF